jgi:hypothetical protein
MSLNFDAQRQTETIIGRWKELLATPPLLVVYFLMNMATTKEKVDFLASAIGIIYFYRNAPPLFCMFTASNLRAICVPPREAAGRVSNNLG